MKCFVAAVTLLVLGNKTIVYYNWVVALLSYFSFCSCVRQIHHHIVIWNFGPRCNLRNSCGHSLN